MTAPPTAPAARRAGAASRATVDWHQIDWRRVNQHVRRLQARIVKAAQEGRWGRVKALQRLLIHSFSGKVSWPFTPSSLIVWQSLRERARIYPWME